MAALSSLHHEARANELLDETATKLETQPEDAKILVIDDEPTTIDIVKTFLADSDYRNLLSTATSTTALDLIRKERPDLLLIDLMMPEVSGFEIIQAVRSEQGLSRIPAIVLSSATDLESRHFALGLGANDYLSKPVDPVELALRVRNQLMTKLYEDRLKHEKERSDRLLANLLPAAIRRRIERGERMLADRLEFATVLFADLVNFTELASQTDPRTLVELLNFIFERFDSIVSRFNLEKIKTIGDAYMLAGGVPLPDDGHVDRVVLAGACMITELEELNRATGLDLKLRIGVHSGPLVAGIIGTHRMHYDLWGDTVNVASRMESTGVPGSIQISQVVHDHLKAEIVLEPRGSVSIKGKGTMATFLIDPNAAQAAMLNESERTFTELEPRLATAN